MEKFNHLTGEAVYLPIANIDTDFIIPKQYLKTIKRSGLGQFLFADRRYDQNGNPDPNFVLNQKPDAKILLAGDNFGCGSSREHAPWALLDFGIRVVVAPSFADIFFNNCFKNGILPIKLAQNDIDVLVKENKIMTVNLPEQSIQSGNAKFYFALDAHRKEVLLQGLDDIEKVLKLEPEINAFEKKYYEKFPWLS
jgi:3-isopropylmalate/(R)-2-methylmalate dehydratase small subunit